jgi:CspA family cold shock protein
MRDENTVRAESDSQEAVECRVKWFNTTKGFGFVEPLNGDGDAFVHVSVLQELDLQGLPEGAAITCDLFKGERGLQVARILDLGPAPVLNRGPGEDGMVSGHVKFFNTQKGFGFITPDDGSPDIFIHMKALEKSGLAILESEQRVRVIVAHGEKGPLADGIELIPAE